MGPIHLNSTDLDSVVRTSAGTSQSQRRTREMEEQAGGYGRMKKQIAYSVPIDREASKELSETSETASNTSALNQSIVRVDPIPCRLTHLSVATKALEEVREFFTPGPGILQTSGNNAGNAYRGALNGFRSGYDFYET
ncbi:hypothetical protein KPH14_004667 [Odynerus spinipes]|uniref:Uncharacterized protein n=1 Tax=Odynerus spinipes TaxID=1348599 RepID=A0AAD9RM79_9HYME|nr:hypothetical protein KPH14_004667 [Odynerus spinipes]